MHDPLPHDLPTVLIADDSDTVRALVRFELESAGYAVVEAENGEVALEQARTGVVDVVLLDVEMPVLDGHATIVQLKADPETAGLPVVFLTARSEGDDVVEALRLGAQDYLRKPPTTSELLARVGAALQVSQLRSELARRTQELDRMSRTDHLTGLFNRRHLDDVLQATAASSRRHSFPFTVLIVDVDHFKQVNDTAGHQAGDEVLQSVARRLSEALRTEDLVGRWGGEEFLVLAPHTDLVGGQVLADRLRADIEATAVPTSAGVLRVTVSIGGAAASEPGDGVEALLRAADRSLYACKAAGRNRAEVVAMPSAPDPDLGAPAVV